MNKYILIIVDHTQIESDLTDFPLLINLSTSSGLNEKNLTEFFTEIGENKYKIRLEDTSGVGHYVEIETWDWANNKAILHTKVNLSSTSDSVFLLYYDANYEDNISYIGVTGSTAAQNVWDSNYKAVYTMAQNPSVGGACILDSTVNANHGTPYGMTSADLVNTVSGGKSLSFNGSTAGINVPSNILSGCSQWSSEVFLNLSSYRATGQSAIMVDRTNTQSDFQIIVLPDNNNPHKFVMVMTNISTSDVPLNTDTYIASSYNLVTSKLFFNGVVDVSVVVTIPPITSTSATCKIGDDPWGNKLSGSIGTIRLSNTARSDDWIAATNKSLRDELCSFYQIGISDFLFVEGTGVVTPGNEAHFNFLPDEDYHILTLSAPLPMLTMEASATAKLPPYNAINIDLPILTCDIEGNSWKGAVGDCYGDMEATLPILECIIYSGGAVIDIILPILIVEMSTPIEPIFAQIDCLIPMIELEMLQIDPISAYMSAVIPMLTASIEGDCKFTGMNISLPVPTMRAYSGVEMTISLPVPNFSMTASAAKAGYLTASLPVPQFVAYSGAVMDITLPVPMVEMVADTPIIAIMNVNLKILSFVMSATSLAPTTLNGILPVPQFIATSRGCLFNSMDCAFPLIDIEMSGINGEVATLAAEIPILHMIMQGFFHREGGNYINITLPILAMYSEAYGATTSEILRHVRGQER